MLEFRKVQDETLITTYLEQTLRAHLEKGEKVLWLIPGGSAIQVAVNVGRQLTGADLTNLTVTLTDERYGDQSHPDSNWRQLTDAGLELPSARLLPVLEGADADATAANWATDLQGLLETCDYKLGFFGIGSDGHTSGILPNSPAVMAPGLVVLYDGGQYQRITTTPAAIIRLDEAVVFAMGEPKREALEGLQTDKPLAEQPAQILKQVPKTTIFNDLIGEAA